MLIKFFPRPHPTTLKADYIFYGGNNEKDFNPKLQEQISHTINPIKSVFSLIFIFYGLNLAGGSSGEKLFGCL
ncbi:hypothetical protein, partial [Levilactobacillus brevis]|uniref:hypothetical protein n=1 Tax=Levilactobacillus brevis TaxID=1580 RepID=UPI001CDC68C2